MSLSSLVFLVAFAVGCTLALARHPIYGLLTYAATLYIDPAGQWWGQGAIQTIRWEFVPAAVTLLAMLIHRKPDTPSPIFRSGAFWGFVVYVAWIAIQSLWALDPVAHRALLTIWIKFLIVAMMIGGCIDSWRHFRLFLWTQVLGCFYLGWLAYTSYTGGRFEGFGAGSFGEANAGALQLVIGLIVASSLFLDGGWRTKALLLAPIAFIANGIVTTVSRSGFLAAATAAIAFNIVTPKMFRLRVGLLSAGAIVLFLSLTTSNYWHRMQTMEYGGADVSGIDTGYARIEIIRAQWKMFQEHPLGCGSMCTTVLSPQFLAPQFLSGGQRASHNTFMSMLVDHGIPGAVMYIALLFWTYSTVRAAARTVRNAGRFQSAVLPALAAVMVAIIVGDLFVQHPRLEARVWFVSLLITYTHLAARDVVTAQNRVAQVPEKLRVSAL